MPDPDDKLPIKMLNDRVLVSTSDDGERRSSGGILIPATAEMAKRLVWATVVAQGQNVRSCEVGDKVLFSPDDRYEVEVQGSDYIMLPRARTPCGRRRTDRSEHRPLPLEPPAPPPLPFVLRFWLF